MRCGRVGYRPIIPGCREYGSDRTVERTGDLRHGQPLSVSPCKDVGIKAILPLPHRVFASHSPIVTHPDK